MLDRSIELGIEILEEAGLDDGLPKVVEDPEVLPSKLVGDGSEDYLKDLGVLLG